jgi:proline dehydrogenase
MLRVLLLYLSGAAWVRRIVMGFPPARYVAMRFVAGETCDDAIAAIRPLNAKGITATADHLGENVFTEEEAFKATDDYIHLLDCIHESGVDSWISLKLTQLGLDISETLCLANMRRILDYARERGIHVAIDMESSEYTQRTLNVFHNLHDEEDYDNVRAVIQSYLFRSEADIETLVEHGAGVRLCKGAYQEPPDVAFPKKADTDANYVKLTEMLLDAAEGGNGGGYPGLATHDESMIEAAKSYAEANGIGRDTFEFQMLHGIRSAMQEALVEEGYRMRVYVPYGTEWYPYLMRRLAEHPANLRFFVGNLFRR